MRHVVKQCGAWMRGMCDVVAGLEKTLEDRRKKHGPHHDRTMEAMYTLAAEYSMRQMYVQPNQTTQFLIGRLVC